MAIRQGCRPSLFDPTFNYPTSFRQTQEQFTIKQFITRLAGEVIQLTVFLRAAWRNEQRVDSGLFQPAGEFPGDEFAAVVATNMPEGSAYGKQVL
jgi:hypothetical protein